MTTRPKVINPLVALYARDGVEVVLVTVEVWETDTVVRLAGRPADPVAEDRRYHESLDAWAGAGRQGQLPRQPGEHILDVDLFLADDLGTTYVTRSAQRGGTGRLYRGDWFFATPVPDAATHLTITATAGDGTEVGSLQLDL